MLEALVRRLETRGVAVVRARARDVVVRDGRAAAVATTVGDLDADVVVCAVDPRRLPALAGYVRRTMPAIPPATTYVGLEGDVRDLPHEVVRARRPDAGGAHPRPGARRSSRLDDPAAGVAATRIRSPLWRGTGSTSASRW